MTNTCSWIDTILAEFLQAEAIVDDVDTARPQSCCRLYVMFHYVLNVSVNNPTHHVLCTVIDFPS